MPVRLAQLLPTSPGSSDPPRLRNFRDATSYLVRNELTKLAEPTAQGQTSPTSSAMCAPPSPIPGRFRAPTRCRLRADRTPSPPRPCFNKAPRSVSPGGTASASAVESRKLRRGITWSPTLITSIWTRPRTLPEDVPLLYYSRADERRFRREAEEERYLLREEAARDGAGRRGGDHEPLWSTERKVKDYAISKAVVIFGETTRTYGSGDAAIPDEDRTACPIAFPSPDGAMNFDDAAFWNGQLTWS